MNLERFCSHAGMVPCSSHSIDERPSTAQDCAISGPSLYSTHPGCCVQEPIRSRSGPVMAVKTKCSARLPRVSGEGQQWRSIAARVRIQMPRYIIAGHASRRLHVHLRPCISDSIACGDFAPFLTMADALCGPSTALQNFQKHTSVDRTLQQDRLVGRHSPAQVSIRSTRARK